MYFLKTYIDFSIKYNILVKDNLNEDVKRLIWTIYKYQISHNIIQNFIRKNIYKCRDCNQANWFFTYGLRQHFYYVPACNHKIYYYTDIPCCMKYICSGPNYCKFTINCKECNKIIICSPNKNNNENNENNANNVNNNSVGWNITEQKKIFIIKCNDCDFINTKNLIWNHNIHKHSIGNIL